LIAVNRTNYQAYNTGLAGIPGIRLYAFDEREQNNYQYVIALLDQTNFGRTQAELIEALKGEGVLARRYFSPGCHAIEPYATAEPEAARRLAVTEAVSHQVVALPTGTQLGPNEIEKICAFIRNLQTNG
jgi:dTDP-4-amino-4,6-dideoxygalactose transaminase